MRTVRLLLAMALATLVMSPTTAAFAAPGLAPVAVDDSYSVAAGHTLNVSTPGVLGNDSDPEGDSFSVTGFTGGAHAQTRSILSGGYLNYTPVAGFTGVDTIDYEITDEFGDTSTATVTITVTPNGAPVAVDDSYSVAAGHTLNVSTPGVLGNDSDPEGDSFSVTGFTGGAHAQTRSILSGGYLNYTPVAGFTGVDTIDYEITDEFGDTSTATVTITVTPNGAPVAVDDSYSVAAGHTLNVSTPGVLGNDSDPEGDSFSVTGFTGGAHAQTRSILSGGYLNYTPVAGFTGVDTIDYEITDEFGDTSTATVTITVTPNGAPVAADDSYSVTGGATLNVAAPGLLANDSDPEGDGLTVTDFTVSPNDATVSVSSDGSLHYTPANGFTGDDTLGYTVSDGHGGTATGTFTIHVSPAPVTLAIVDDEYSIDEDGILTVAAPGFLGNDTLPSGSSLGACTAAIHGTVTCHTDGSLTFLPDEGFSGDASFVYSINGPVVPTLARAAALAANQGLVTVHVRAKEATTDDSGLLPDTGNPVAPLLPVVGAFLVLAGFMVLRKSRRLT